MPAERVAVRHKCGAQIANIAGFMKPKQAGNLMHLKIIAHYYTLGITAVFNSWAA